MNSLEDAIGIVCHDFLVPDPEGEGMTADQVIEELMESFLNVMEPQELRFFLTQKMKNSYDFTKRNKKKNVYKCAHRFDLSSST